MKIRILNGDTMMYLPARQNNSKGFTLVELMVTLVISGFIVGALYTSYLSQQRSSLAQDQVAEMQQNIRAALMMMSRDIRMAGYDPKSSSGAGFDDVQGDALAFSADLNGDGDVNDAGEHIGYDLYTPTGGVSTLGRTSSNSTLSLTDKGGGHYEVTGHQPLAENIDKLEFYYTLEGGSQTLSPATPGNIRSIQISILARARKIDRKYTVTDLYCPASHPIRDLANSQCKDSTGNTLASATWGPYNDNFRRRLLVTTVQCRNMGLND